MDSSRLRAMDICNDAVVTADVSTSLTEVARTMRQHHVGDVVITLDDAPIGILTDRDLVVHGMAFGVDLSSVTAGDLSTQTLVSVKPEADLYEIVTAMNKHAVRRVVVSDDEKMTGIATLDDVLRALSLLVQNLTALTARQIENEGRREVPLMASEHANTG